MLGIIRFSKTIRTDRIFNQIRSVRSYRLVIITSLFVMSACFALPLEEPVLPPPIVQEFQPAEHATVTLVRGNLTRYRNLSVNVVPAVEVPLMFSIPDIYIQAVHVSVGDEVRAGDIVAELDRDGFVRALYHAQRDETAAHINIAHLGERQPLDALEAAIRGDAIDESQYTEERGALQTELAARQLLTQHLQAEDERRVLRSPINGTVTHTLAFRDGDVSMLDVRVVTIADETRSIFSVTGWETRYLIPGDMHTVTVNWEPFESIVIDPDEWGLTPGENQAFLIAYDEGAAYFPARVFASLHLILEEVENVISVPFSAVHTVEDRVFVYVMEDGIRVLRDIETGMEGNAGVEVVAGLSEGEIVVID